MSHAAVTYQSLAERARIDAQAHKAYERVRETAEDAGLVPLTGEVDRSLRLMMLDYFEACEQAKHKAKTWNAIGIAVFTAIVIGLTHLEIQMLHHMQVIS